MKFLLANVGLLVLIGLSACRQEEKKLKVQVALPDVRLSLPELEIINESNDGGVNRLRFRNIGLSDKNLHDKFKTFLGDDWREIENNFYFSVRKEWLKLADESGESEELRKLAERKLNRIDSDYGNHKLFISEKFPDDMISVFPIKAFGSEAEPPVYVEVAVLNRKAMGSATVFLKKDQASEN